MSGSRAGAALRALGRVLVESLATEHGWCWAACTLGTFPIGTALAAHAPRERYERDARTDLSDESPVRTVRPRDRTGQAWA